MSESPKLLVEEPTVFEKPANSVTRAVSNFLEIAYAQFLAYLSMIVYECITCAASRSSIAKDASYKVKMVKDREFLKFATNENFVAISK